MMPQLLTVRVKRPDGRAHPDLGASPPVVLVFSPVVILAALVAAVACLVYRVSRGAGTRHRLAASSPRCPAPGSTSSRAARPCS